MSLRYKILTALIAGSFSGSGCKTAINGSQGKASRTSLHHQEEIPESTLTDLAASAYDVAERYQGKFEQAGETAIASQLKRELEALKASPPSEWVSPEFGVGFFPLPIVTANNPYLQALETSAKDFLSEEGECGPLSTKDRSLYPKESYQQARKVASELEQLFFLIASPQSRYRFHPGLGQRFFCRLYATAYDYFLHGGKGLNIPGSTPNALDDWFATGPMIYSWGMATQTMGQLIPPSFKRFMATAAERAGDAVMAVETTPRYANRDISYAEILLQAGRFLDQSRLINQANHLLRQTCDSIYPDGAFPYIWNQNECINYHAGNLRSIGRIYAMTGSATAKDCLIKAKAYEVLTVEPGNVSEYYTSPAWKTMWNTINGIDGAEPVAALTGDPILRGMIDQEIAAKGAKASPLYASFYRNDITARPPANRYIVWDRNILGPRGRFDDFSYAITGRDITSERTTDPGHLTLVGAMLTEPVAENNRQRRLQSALMAVYPKVQVAASTNEQEWNSWAYLRSRLQANSVLTQAAAGFAATSRLQTQSAGPRAREYPWSATELWLALDDRLVGFVETTAQTGAKAFQINGRIKLGYGRTGARQPQELSTLTAGRAYRYGGLVIRLHQHSYRSVRTSKAGIIRDEPPLDAREIVLSDQQDPSDRKERPYDAGSGGFFLVEIAKAEAPPLETVDIKRQGNLRTLFVRKASRAYALSFNTSNTDANFAIDPRIANESTTLWSVDRRGEKPVKRGIESLNLGSGGIALAVSTPESSEGELGWYLIDELLGK